jgi:hypothetical protein
MNNEIKTLYTFLFSVPLKLVFRSSRYHFVKYAVYVSITSILVSFFTRLYFDKKFPYYVFTIIFTLSVFYILHELSATRNSEAKYLQPLEKSLLPLVFVLAIFIAIVKSIKFHIWP